jgi:hypothetical protein
MLREFYTSDAKFQAGVQGFMEWYYTEGIELLGMTITLDDTEAFTISDLMADDIAIYPVSEDIVIDPSLEPGEEGHSEPRDVTKAKGVVSLALMDCDWKRTESYLVRSDQDVVFAGDFEGYEREYLSDRATFEQASVDESFDPIPEDLNPFVEGFNPDLYARSLMMTTNQMDPTPVLIADLDSYPMNLDLRHGVFDVADGAGTLQPTGVNAIVTYQLEAAWGSAGANALLQSYSVEINVQQPNDQTLRLLAVWAEPVGGGIEADDPIALNFAVNKSTQSSQRLSDICAGVQEIPDEEL